MSSIASLSWVPHKEPVKLSRSLLASAIAAALCLFAVNIHDYAEVEGWPTWRRSYPEDPKIKLKEFKWEPFGPEWRQDKELLGSAQSCWKGREHDP